MNNLRSKSFIPKSTQGDPRQKVKHLQSTLIFATESPKYFQKNHSKIFGNPQGDVNSLSQATMEGPVSIHWQDSSGAKVLIRNLGWISREDRIESTAETVLAHIEEFQERKLPFPGEIYLYTGNQGIKNESNLKNFSDKLVEAINNLNKTNYEISSRENIDGRYIRLKLGKDQAEESIFRSARKSDTDSEGDGKSTKRSEKDEEEDEQPRVRGRGGRDVRDEPTQFESKRDREKQRARQIVVKLGNDLGATDRPVEKTTTRQGQPQGQPSPEKRKTAVFDAKRIEEGFRTIFITVKDLDPDYDAGDRGATTFLNVKGEDEEEASTSNNVHAELGALNVGLDRGFLKINEDGKIRVVRKGERPRPLDPEEFTTRNRNNRKNKMKHCGYCTFFLTVMEVPTESPTFEPSDFAGSQHGSKIPYKLPDPIREHPAIIAKALGFGNATEFIDQTKTEIKEFLDVIEKKRPGETSDLEKIVYRSSKQLKIWIGSDNEEQGPEQRFRALLKQGFGVRKDDFLEVLWNRVLNDLTEVMQRRKEERMTFAGITKKQ